MILLFGIKTGNKKSLVHLPRQLHSSPGDGFTHFIIIVMITTVRPVVFLTRLFLNVSLILFFPVQCPREQPRKRWFLMRKEKMKNSQDN